MKLPRWIAWLLHRLPKDAKAKAFDVAVDKMSKPEKEVIGPKSPFIDRGPSDRIEKRKRKP